MEKIKTLENIKNMQTLSQALQKHLISYFSELHKSLGNGKPVSEFSLEEHGPITLLFGADDLNQEKLLQSWPEYIEKLRFNGEYIYRIFVLRNNSYMDIYYYFPRDELTPEIKTWIEKYTSCETNIDPPDNTDIPF